MKNLKSYFPIYLLSASLVFVGISASSQAEGATTSLEKRVLKLESKLKDYADIIDGLDSDRTLAYERIVKLELTAASPGASSASKFQTLSFLNMNKCPAWTGVIGRQMFTINYTGTSGSSGPLAVVWCDATIATK